jgi:ATP/ADP translocase
MFPFNLLKVLQLLLLNKINNSIENGNDWLIPVSEFIQHYFIEIGFVVVCIIVLIITIQLFRYLDRKQHQKPHATNKANLNNSHAKIGKGVDSLRKAYDEKIITESEFLHNVLKLTEENKN